MPKAITESLFSLAPPVYKGLIEQNAISCNELENQALAKPESLD